MACRLERCKRKNDSAPSEKSKWCPPEVETQSTGDEDSELTGTNQRSKGGAGFVWVFSVHSGLSNCRSASKNDISIARWSSLVCVTLCTRFMGGVAPCISTFFNRFVGEASRPRTRPACYFFQENYLVLCFLIVGETG